MFGKRKMSQSRPALNLSVPEGESESKRDRTKRLANQRARKLIDYMKFVGNLGRPGHDLGTENVEKLIPVLEREFNFMVEQLRHGAAGKSGDII